MSVVARLEAQGLTTLVLDPYSGYVIQSFDPGDARTRAVVTDGVNINGTDDDTMFIGERAITLNLKLVPTTERTRESMRQRIKAFTAPSLRPVLYVAIDGDAEKRITLRRSQFSGVIGAAGAAIVTVQWIAPLGIFESSTLHDQLVYAAGSGPAVGRTYPLTFNRVYPASDPLGSATLTNSGDIDAYPILRLFGPATDPVFDNTTQGLSITFTGLTVAAGDYVEIDLRNKTVLLNGSSASSLYDKLAFPTTQFWSLSPGDNIVRFHPATFTAGVTVAECLWRDAYL